ncbi:MAG: aldH [Planctomycetaceae bacterium]|nr:aldH [Planctomycetaceae bacterium]
MSSQPVLIGGEWVSSIATKIFQASNPATGEVLPGVYPVSPWSEIERAIQSAASAAKVMRGWSGERFAKFLEAYAVRIEAKKAELVAQAHLETALPAEGRLAGNELPRTINQLKTAAVAARSASWCSPTIDSKANIRSQFGPIGPVVVFGPNNFPFAFNGISGGDFAAAIAAGNPVIAKGHPSHPGTTRIFAEEALQAAKQTEMPPGFVQLIYRTEHADGVKLVSHPLIGATGYTGGRNTGLTLKDAADKAGKPIYLELSSINPVVILPGALAERGDKIAEEFSASCLMGVGQFCTNPGLVLLLQGPATDRFREDVRQRFAAAPVGTLLGSGVSKSLEQGVNTLAAHGATVETGGKIGGGKGASFQNTLLRTSGALFLKEPHALQTETFGNSTLFVECQSITELVQVLDVLEGNLTGSVYSDTTGKDDSNYEKVAPALRHRVGRLLNDKMPTGVAVSPAMNHGGPFPATGHPAFTAVGIPASIHRFGMLQCYDSVRESRLPETLKNRNSGGIWRFVDGTWTQADVSI